MSEKVSDEIWTSITRGLPPVPSADPDRLPIPELLRVIKYCLDSRVEKFDIAVDLAKEVYKSNPAIEVLNWLGAVCFSAKKWQQAYEISEKLAKLDMNPGTAFNLSKAAYKIGDPKKAEEIVRLVLALDPTDKIPMMDLAVYICSQGRFDEAYDVLKNIDSSSLDDKHKKILEFNKGWHEVRRGNFKRGVELLNIGRSISIWGNNARKHPCPEWDGTPYPGKTVLLGGEAGIGDEIIAIRFAKNIKEMGMRCIASTVHGNHSIFERIPYIDKVYKDKELNTFQDYDYWVSSMSTVKVLGLDIADISSEPYITPDPAYVEKWSKIIPNKGKKRIGVRWAGNKLYELELFRTLPFSKLDALTKFDADFYSVQRDSGVEDMTPGTRIVPLHEQLTHIEDLLGAISNLDLVITSCTSIAHIAGAMGKETWVCPPIMSYWIWASPADKSPWYKNVTLFRQEKWNNWDSTFEKLELALEKYLET